MENKIYCLVKRLKADRVRRQRFAAVMIVLSMIVSSTVFWQLHSTGNALTDEFLCGMSEHRHTAECLSPECGNESEDHVHTAQCYAFTCGKSSHLHTAQCRSDISADIETEDVWEATLPEEMTGNKCENIAAVAESQLGYTESTKNFIIADDGVTRKGYTRYGKWYGNPYGDWNTLFAYFCLYYAGVTEKELPYGSGCWAWTEALKKAELFSSLEDVTVKVGDLVFFDTDADEKPDRVGIVSEIKEDEESGITITAIEGDLDGKVDKAEYSLEDEKLAGFVSMDMFAESDFEFPELSLGDSEMAAYASNGTSDIVLNGSSNNTTQDNPYVVESGTSITVENITQYVTITQEQFENKSYSDPSGDNQSWRYHNIEGTPIFTLANSWGIKNPDTTTGRSYYFNSSGELICSETITLNLAEVETEKDVTYTFHDHDETNRNFYIKVVPDTSTPTPDPQPTGTKIHMIKPTRQDTNEHLTAETAFSVQPGDSVTLVGTVDKNKYTVYPNAEAYNQAKAANTDPVRQFVHVGNKYISTYARFWGLNDDHETNPDAPVRFDGRVERYDFDSDDNLTVIVTYTAKEIGITTDNKYVVTFADGADWDSYEQFWLTNDATMLYVYSTVGWRDIDRVNEAMDGKGGDSGNGKYWKNGKGAGDGYPGNFNAGQYYVVHPGDWIYLAGEGNGEFKNLGPWDATKSETNDGKSILQTNGAKPTGDTSSNKTYVKLQMPTSVNGATYYKIDYEVLGVTKTFYFKLSDESTSGNKVYDHADIEIADGGIYKMVAEHHVNPDGTMIETIRTYGASITKVFKCDVKSVNSTLITIPGGDYSSQGAPGDTQYELTSKYKTNGEGKRVDKNGNIIENGNGELVIGVRKFTQTEVESADFYVNVHLIPESEITTITYPDGSTEQIINADFDASAPIDVEDVKLEMNHQSVIDAVNKCPDHSGLDFTIRDEEITSKLRSGSAIIEASKRLETDTQTDISDELVGGEFEFELYKCDDDTYNITGKTPVSTVTNNANGYVYFDQQFYIYPGTGELPHTDYYVIKEKIPNSPDADITYSTREVKVTITYKPDDTSGSPTYKTTVKYDDVEGAIPEFVNIKKAYTLPSTGGSGTTIFYICGPALMLTAAALFVIRRRKEENQH